MLARPEALTLALVLWLTWVAPAESIDLRLSTSQETTFRGDSLSVVLEAAPSGDANTGDLYVSVQTPDGTVLYSLHPAPLPGAYQFRVAALDASGRPSPGPESHRQCAFPEHDLHRQSLPVGLLSGRYLFFAVMVRPGTSPRDSGTFLSILATKDVRIF